ncbi:proteinase-activated receptor 1-like [Scomber scombrus]|uniref:Proteinase-activated receptor 1 n=1 Tax=Scomber scombrus TaxID=13677 RepID=A0AAV1N5G5_SCOSC
MASFFGSEMISMFPKTLLLVLLCVCASSATKNGSEPVLTIFDWTSEDTVRDEPLPPEYTDKDRDTETQREGIEPLLTYFDWTSKDTVRDEPLSPEYTDEDGEDTNSTRVRGHNGTHNVSHIRQEISEEALQFLRGRVSTVLIPSFYTLVCLISVPFNICAVIAFGWRIKPKKPAAIYMLNLACADLIFALLLPFKISYHFGGNNWIFGPIMCRVVTAAFYWNMYCSVLLITCISVDRLLAIVYPIDSLVWRTPQNSIIACVTMWILSFAGSVPLVVSEQSVHLTQLDITTCHDIQRSDQQIWHYKIYFIILCCLLFFLPLLITVVSYTRAIWSLSRVPRGDPGRSRRRMRAVVMVLTVLVIFVLCFMPTNCLLLAHYLQFNEGMKNPQQAPDVSYTIYLVFLCLGSLNCLLDPLVYYFGSSQCRKQLSKALRCQKIT